MMVSVRSSNTVCSLPTMMRTTHESTMISTDSEHSLNPLTRQSSDRTAPYERETGSVSSEIALIAGVCNVEQAIDG